MRFLLAVILAVLAPSAWADGVPRPVEDSDFAPVNMDEARLGQLLFYDPILSGNRNIACATCHHPSLGTADGVSLSIGEGGLGLGPERRVDPAHLPEALIPRNAPGLFNLGAAEFQVMFHDGRLEADPSFPGGVRTPMDADMMVGFASVLSAQTMFPVLSRDEMAGAFDENDIGRAVRQGLITGDDGAWGLIAARVAQIPVYAAQFEAVYPHIDGPDDIAFTDVSNAIAVFMAFEWRSDTAPFDAALRGDLALQGAALAGMELFYGDAGCASCHSGAYLTDHQFHAMGAAQIGPGKAASFEDHTRDEGRYRVTGDPADLYAFRTPSLRNVMLTGPYGHAGAVADLEAFVRGHADPLAGLAAFDPAGAILPVTQGDPFAPMADAQAVAAIAAAVSQPAVQLSDQDVAALLAFMDALTDPVAIEGRLGSPATVPSGLPVPD